MGYELPAPTVTVEFDATTSYEEFWFKAKSVSAQEWLDLRGGSDKNLINQWAKNLVEWNAEADGQPVEPTTANAMRQHPGLILSAAIAWLNGMSRVERPKGRTAQTGPPTDLVEAALAELPG